jgi:hypothetical protein
MGNKKRWIETNEGYGIISIAVSGWKHFPTLIHEHFSDTKMYIWRGQRCSNWPLQSSLQRRLPESVSSPGLTARNHLHRFQYATRGRRGPSPSELKAENDWWALGQHFGLGTPLLDWTTSPFVAAYFAFRDTGPSQTKSRAVYALNQPAVVRKSHELKEKNEENPDWDGEVEFVRPRSDENARLVNQAGLFTRSPMSFSSIESWVQESFRQDSIARVLVKITIPNSGRENALRMMNRMNINDLTLFPDLGGAAAFTNMHLEIPKY